MDKCDLRFKSVPEITTSENVLTFQNQKFSEDTSHAPMSSFNADILSNLDIDDSISDNIININTRPNMPTDLGAGTGKTTRKLRPRQHMDYLSTCVSNLCPSINKCKRMHNL